MRDLTTPFERALQALNAAAEMLEVLSDQATHVIDPTNPGQCSVCNGEETVRELDWATRWNSLRAPYNGFGVDVHQQDPEFETIAYFCYSCKTPYKMAPGVVPDWL